MACMLVSETQRAINDAEWANPDNWRRGILFPVYFSKRDSRVMVGVFWQGAEESIACR